MPPPPRPRLSPALIQAVGLLLLVAGAAGLAAVAFTIHPLLGAALLSGSAATVGYLLATYDGEA